MPRNAIGADPRVRAHDPGPAHPEQIARYTAVSRRLISAGLIENAHAVEPRLASDDELALVHERNYLELVEREIAQNRSQLSTGDTAINRHSSEAARAASGCALNAVDAVCSKLVENAFCAVRPPGHHASAARGMGFCLFNHVAVAARYAQRKYQIERVAIIDWDVHHGNGTQDIFYEDGSVLFFSTHQSPWYPGTGSAKERGAGPGIGTTINCPFPAGSGRAEIFGAFERSFLPVVRQFRPGLLLISAGFDSRMDDPLGQFRLIDQDFADLTVKAMEVADQCCEKRLISLLEGGYSLEGLANGVEAHVRALQN